jgi:hypothetical protein
LRPPWIGRDLLVPRDDRLLAEFAGFWWKVGVTEKLLVVSDGWSVKLEAISEIEAGFDPSPHDEGGPLWGIWITLADGEERGFSLFRPAWAAQAIERQKTAVAPTSQPGVVSAESWRVTVAFEDASPSQSRAGRNSAKHFVKAECGRLRDVTVSRAGGRVFLYADTEAPAREALRTVGDRIRQEGSAAISVLERWDPVEQEWSQADTKANR